MSITSLGFRGEALSSIAAVSQVDNYVEELLLAAIPKLEKKTADMLEEGYLRQGTAAALLAQLYLSLIHI